MIFVTYQKVYSHYTRLIAIGKSNRRYSNHAKDEHNQYQASEHPGTAAEDVYKGSLNCKSNSIYINTSR